MSVRSGASASLNQDRVSDASASPPTGHDEAAPPLPRQLLVSLAGTAADITSLRQRFGDDPQLREPLDRILGKLDAVVDSVYERAAAARLIDPASGHGAAITAGHPAEAAVGRAGEHRDS